MTALITTLATNAKRAAREIALASSEQKNRALQAIAKSIRAQEAKIIAANAEDLARARGDGLSEAYLDRLTLTPARIAQMATGIEQIAALPDPVGEITTLRRNDNGLQIGRMRVPLGVIGIIYESRPNVTADAAALCLKAGNAAILRGGSEAIASNLAIMRAIAEGLQTAQFSQPIVQLVDDPDRAHVTALLACEGLIDVIIPRGGRNLVALVSDNARMPVLKHLDGICHIYVDAAADLAKAWRVCDNGKTYRYGICGATETLLVHEAIAAEFLPPMGEIFRRKGVEIRACAQTRTFIPDSQPASSDDWRTEYLAPVLSIKIVPDAAAAIDHIAEYGSGHTDAIVTENLATAEHFLRAVDSASVMVNTPTCFADGYQYGLGAEIGISTDKIHWRGPVGVVGLTCEKFIVFSDGATRQ